MVEDLNKKLQYVVAKLREHHFHFKKFEMFPPRTIIPFLESKNLQF